MTTQQLLPQTRRFAVDKPALRQRFEDLGMQVVGRLGVALHGMLGSRARNSLGILTYHRIADHVRGLPGPLHNVTPERFREQLQGLLKYGFTFWPLQAVLSYHDKGQPIPPRTVILTFDDGFESVYVHAWPVLKELNVPATIFVNTAYLNSEDPFPFDAWGVAHENRAPATSYRPLKDWQCRQMNDSGLVEIGAHTHTHEDFRGRPDAFRLDLALSADIVRERFGQQNVTFAVPYGSPRAGFAGDNLVAAAKATGVICGLTTESVLVDPSIDPFRWGRFNAFAWDTSATLAAKLGGWYSWAPKLRQRLAACCRP